MNRMSRGRSYLRVACDLGRRRFGLQKQSLLRLSGSDVFENGLEGTCAVPARAIESGSNRGFVIGSPFCAIAIRRFSLDEARPKPSFAFVLGGCGQAGKVDAGQQLISGSGYLSEKVLREQALAGARKFVL